MSNTEYDVESIRDIESGRGGELRVLIKWENYPEEDNSWEPVTNIQSLSSLGIIDNLRRKVQHDTQKSKLVERLLTHFRSAYKSTVGSSYFRDVSNGQLAAVGDASASRNHVHAPVLTGRSAQPETDLLAGRDDSLRPASVYTPKKPNSWPKALISAVQAGACATSEGSTTGAIPMMLPCAP